MDAAPCHLGLDVLRACRSCGFSLILIPALMTSMLAPLDTHVFSIYKYTLKERCDAARSASAGDIGVEAFMHCLANAMTDIFQCRSWSHAFAHNGMCWNHDNVADSLLKQLGLTREGARPHVGAPTLEDLQTCVPRRSRSARNIFELLYTTTALRSAGGLEVSHKSRCVRQCWCTYVDIGANAVGNQAFAMRVICYVSHAK